jgi:hypothetical protein
VKAKLIGPQNHAHARRPLSHRAAPAAGAAERQPHGLGSTFGPLRFAATWRPSSARAAGGEPSGR